MSYFHSFRALLDACRRFSQTLPPVQLNGYLSAIAAGPEPLDELSWQEGILGTGSVSDEVRELAEECLEAIRDDICNQEYQPYLVEGRSGKPQVASWMRGFNQAVDLDEPTWREYNDTYLDAAKVYIFLQSLDDPGIAEVFGFKPSRHKKYVKESLDSIAPAVEKLYNNYRDLEEESYEPLPEHPPEELREYCDASLIELLTSEGDLLPRSVVDECVQRRESLLPHLRGLLEEPTYYSDEYAGEPRWWAPLHAINILGAMEGRAAAEVLLYAMEAMHHYSGREIWNLVSGYWPALFCNKGAYAAEALQAMADNRELRWQPRLNAFECLLDKASAQGPEALDRILARVSAVVGDPSEEYPLRMVLAQHLLDHPRKAHRALLEQLAKEQEESATLDIFFDTDEVAEVYKRGEDLPQWEGYMDFLYRYDPEEIRDRQIRERMDELIDRDEWNDPEDDLFAPPAEAPETYTRPTPKVGRNDPCPCGSGKKYKKCCGR